MNRKRSHHLISVGSGRDTDGIVGDAIVRALRLPEPPDRGRVRMPRVNLGQLHAAFDARSLGFALALIDSDGRIASRQSIERLAWTAEQSFVCALGDTYAVVRRAAEGERMLDRRLRLKLGWTVLRYCGIAAGDQALLTTVDEHNMLIVHPLSNLAQMARMFHGAQYIRALDEDGRT